MLGDVGDPQLVRSLTRELAVDQVIGGDHAAHASDPRRPRQSVDPGAAHQDRDEPLADLDVHANLQLGMHPAGPVGAPRAQVHLPDQPGQPGQPLSARLGRRDGALSVLVVAGAADTEHAAADLGR